MWECSVTFRRTSHLAADCPIAVGAAAEASDVQIRMSFVWRTASYTLVMLLCSVGGV